MNSINLSFHTKKRLTLLLGLGLSWGAVITAVFLQFHYQLNPCPLCILSRIILIVAGCIFCCWLAQSFIKKSGDKFYFLIASLVMLCGLALSSYHIWLTLLPAEKLPACGPDLNYLLETLPLSEAIIEAFKGSGSCAQNTFRLLGLSLAQLEWALYFMLFSLNIYIWRHIKATHKTRGA
jgi:protein dithiol:quinone oxidoreductase